MTSYTLKADDPASLTFHLPFGHAGVLRFKGGKATFEGDADASAQVFIDHVIKKYDPLVTHLQRREQELLEANNRYLDRAREAEARIEAEQKAQEVVTSIDTMKQAAWDLVRKNGWPANARLSLHQVTALMAELAMQVSRGDVGCGYPNCGCCADAACEDAIKQQQDFRPVKRQRQVYPFSPVEPNGSATTASGTSPTTGNALSEGDGE